MADPINLPIIKRGYSMKPLAAAAVGLALVLSACVEDTGTVEPVPTTDESSNTSEDSTRKTDPDGTVIDIVADDESNAAQVVAEKVGATFIAASSTEPGDGTELIASREGKSYTVQGSSALTTDGDYIYFNEDDSSQVANFEGVLVCEVGDGDVVEMIEADSGDLLAIVDRESELDEGLGDVPRYSFNCKTSEEEQIDSQTKAVEAGYESKEKVGDLEFTIFGGAEGNANIENSTGDVLNGDDIAAYPVFNQDGSALMYTVQDSSAASSMSKELKAVSTDNGDQLWSYASTEFITGVYVVGDKVVLMTGTSDEPGSVEVKNAVVVDQANGEEVEVFETDLRPMIIE